MPQQKRSQPALLKINDLRSAIGKKDIVRGLDLTVRKGEIHALMGPNGSGKSTLVSTLMGHPQYTVTGGSATFAGHALFKLSPDARAALGLFLAFQYPKEIAGLSLRSFLFAASETLKRARDPNHRKMSPIKFQNLLAETMNGLRMDPALAERSVNQGFSGGEKKKAEILQMQILEPTLALLDETDSGLDIDALHIVAHGVEQMRGPKFSAIIVTHYARLLDFIKPDKVHVMVRGTIVESGGPELAARLEREGYKQYGIQEEPA